MPSNVLRMHLKLLRASYLRPFLFAAVTCAVLTTTGFAKDTAAGLHYLKAGRPNAAELLASPPLAGSSEQAADLAEVRALTKACASNDIAAASAEKKFSLLTFNAAVGGVLQPGKFPTTEGFFERVQGDATKVVDEAKEQWKRPRPYTIEPSLASGKLETSFSYPSGHSTEAMVVALVLADLFPEQRDAILAVGREIGWHRVLIGRHYPTDIYAGRVLAQAIVREMRSSAAFQHDLAKVKAEIAAAKN